MTQKGATALEVVRPVDIGGRYHPHHTTLLKVSSPGRMPNRPVSFPMRFERIGVSVFPELVQEAALPAVSPWWWSK